MPYRLKHMVEYAVLRGVAGLVNRLPYRAALALGWALAWPVFHIGRFRVASVRARMRSVFGDRYSEPELKHKAWISWRNTVFNAIEMLRVPKATEAWIHKHFDCDTYMTPLRRHCQQGAGAVIACPHMGNWDLAGIACFRHGIPVFNIAARQRNPLVTAYLDRLRAQPGIETLTRGKASMRPVVKRLKAGHTLAILPDSRMKSDGIPIPFLGGEANLGKGMALFARLADVPIFPGVARRQGWTRHHIEAFPPVYPDKTLDKDEDIRRMTRLVMQMFDKAVQATPEQWFWFNTRWVLDPLEPAREGEDR